MATTTGVGWGKPQAHPNVAVHIDVPTLGFAPLTPTYEPPDYVHIVMSKEVDIFGYPARFIRERDGYVVSFRDIPEALTSGSTKNEALGMAGDALATAMEFYFEDRRQIPMPSKARKGEEVVDLSASFAVIVRLLNEMPLSVSTLKSRED